MERFKFLLFLFVFLSLQSWGFDDFKAVYALQKKGFPFGDLTVRSYHTKTEYRIDGFLKSSVSYKMLGFNDGYERSFGTLDSDGNFRTSYYEKKVDKGNRAPIFVAYEFDTKNHRIEFSHQNNRQSVHYNKDLNPSDLYTFILQFLSDIKLDKSRKYSLLDGDEVVTYQVINNKPLIWKKKSGGLLPVQEYRLIGGSYLMIVDVGFDPLRIVKLQMFTNSTAQMRMILKKYDLLN